MSNSQNHQIHQSHQIHQIHQILVIDCRMSTVYRGLVLLTIVLYSRALWTLTNEHQGEGILQQQVWATSTGNLCFVGVKVGGRQLVSSSLRVVVCAVYKALGGTNLLESEQCWLNIPEQSGYLSLRRMEWIAFRCDSPMPSTRWPMPKPHKENNSQ